jgi:hypothetical protein
MRVKEPMEAEIMFDHPEGKDCAIARLIKQGFTVELLDDRIDEHEGVAESKPAAKLGCSANAWPRPRRALLHGQPSTTPKPAFPSCQSHRTGRANPRGIPIRLKPRRRKRLDGKPRRSVH